MNCDREHCLVEGHVVMICEDLRLWAQTLDVQLGPDRSFAGATARGDVLMVQGTSVMRCQEMNVGPDRIRGSVSGATVVVKPVGASRNAEGIPEGRNTATFHGDIERVGTRDLRITDADLTLCDCGEAPPSWVLRAPRVEATLGERAVVWWPVLWITPVESLQLPITPPLPPLSLPLKGRAPGMLAPQIALYRAPWPMLDIPVFWPLGRSWDVTLTPGLRTDWGKQQPTPPSAWGAPRLGTRLRYAPSTTTQGELQTSWTYDSKHGAARALLRDAGLSGPACGATSTEPRCALVHRVSVSWKHETQILPYLDWLVDAQWLSDDLILPDFRLSLTEQAPGYAPSRTQLLGRSPLASTELSADYLLRLNNGAVDGYSNTTGAERLSGHRGPYARLHVAPISVAKGLDATVDVSAVRYGAWVQDVTPALVLGGAVGTLAYRPSLRAVRAEVFGSVDSLWQSGAETDDRLHTMLLLGARLDTTLARSFGELLHTVTPALTYRSVPWQSENVAAPLTYDERLQRRRFQQAMVSFEQALWTRRGGSARKLAALELRQPWEVRHGELLQSQALVTVPLGDVGSLAVWGSFDLRRSKPAQELGGSLGLHLGLASARATYSRWYGDADRLRRSIYELAAPSLETAAGPLALHVVGLSGGVRSGKAWSIDYRTALLLPLGDATSDVSLPAFNQHVAALTYYSPCECWAVQVTTSVTPRPDTTASAFENFLEGDRRIAFSFTIGGYSLGSN